MKIGFTLIELLAVIAILSIIAILAVPAVLELFKDAKRSSFELEVQNIIKAAEQGYASSLFKGNANNTTYIYENGIESKTGDISLNLSGKKIQNGRITITSTGEVSVSISDNTFCASKSIDSDQLLIEEKSLEECFVISSTPEECFFTNLLEAHPGIQDFYQMVVSSFTLEESNYEGVIRTTDLGVNDAYTNPNCSTDIVISGTIVGKNIIGIGAGFSILDFEDISTVGFTSIEIPNTITHIGASAFTTNSLEALTIPNSVLYIGTNSFSDNVITSLVIPDNVLSIAMATFTFNRLASVDIGSGITVLDEDVFSYNLISSIEIPSNITEIYGWALYENQLESIAIPNSVTSIGISAIRYNYIPQGDATIDNSELNVSINNYAFDNNGLDRVTPITPVFLR